MGGTVTKCGALEVCGGAQPVFYVPERASHKLGACVVFLRDDVVHTDAVEVARGEHCRLSTTAICVNEFQANIELFQQFRKRNNMQ